VNKIKITSAPCAVTTFSKKSETIFESRQITAGVATVNVNLGKDVTNTGGKFDLSLYL
jgi:hypothetical protein